MDKITGRQFLDEVKLISIENRVSYMEETVKQIVNHINNNQNNEICFYSYEEQINRFNEFIKTYLNSR